jgi:hypothetical protein
VINGQAGDSLLDTYQEERRDAALWTMENTTRNADEIFSVAAGACPIVFLQNGRDFAADGFEELYGIFSGGAVLVRPDGYVGARWTEPSPNFTEQFQSAFASILRNTHSEKMMA